MSTEQGQTGAVDVLLASIDEALADVGSAPPTADPAAAALTPDQDPTSDQPRTAEPSTPPVTAAEPVTGRSDVPQPVAPEPRTAPGRPRQDDWWDHVYKDQNADLDTNTGNLPSRRPPAGEAQAPGVDSGAPATVADLDKHQKPVPSNEREPAIPPDDVQKSTASIRARIAELLFVQTASAKSDGPKGPNHRLRKLAYNGTAAGAGWALGLVSLFEHVVDTSTAYAVPVTAVALAAGVTSVALRIKGGGFVLIGALGLTALFQIVTPGWVVGAGIPLVLAPIDAPLRIWLQRADPTSKAWKAVAWVLRIPLATAVIALLLHGTN